MKATPRQKLKGSSPWEGVALLVLKISFEKVLCSIIALAKNVFVRHQMAKAKNA
jgi:hypothetical protein